MWEKILKTFLSVQCVDAILNTTLVIVIWENYEKIERCCDYRLLIGKKFHLDEYVLRARKACKESNNLIQIGADRF